MPCWSGGVFPRALAILGFVALLDVPLGSCEVTEGGNSTTTSLRHRSRHAASAVTVSTSGSGVAVCQGAGALPVSVYVWNYDVVGASSSGVSCASPPEQRDAFRVFDPANSAEVETLAVAQGVGIVFLDYYVWCIGHVPFPALYHAVKRIRASGKSVYALVSSDIVGVEGAEDGKLGHYKSWLAWKGNGLTCEQPKCEEGWVQGVAANIEEGITADEFSDETSRKFDNVMTEAKKLGLKVHASLGHWWYDEHPAETEVVGDSADSLDIQAYFAPCHITSRGGCVNNTAYPADWIEEAVRPELARWGSKLTIAIETSAHVADRYSWSEEGEVAMWTFFQNQLSTQPTYSDVGGWSVHFWQRSFRGGTDGWPALCPH